MTVRAPFGSWKSPISAELIVSGSVGLSQPSFSNGELYWLELRPAEGGRNVLVTRDANGLVRDVTPREFNVRTRVHEYGGGDYVVAGDDVYFANFIDQRIYAGPTPRAITPESMRYADFNFDRKRKRLICVREDHSSATVTNSIVALHLDQNNNGGVNLVAGNDFYSSPRLSPNGKQLAWITWNHPNMPWDGTELWLGELNEEGKLESSTCVAGGMNESIVQPEWSPDGQLYFISDRNGWWNIYRLSDNQAEAVCEMSAEFALPQWVFNRPTYDFESADRIVCAYVQNGSSRLAIIEVSHGRLETLATGFTDISYVRAESGKCVFRAGSPKSVSALVTLDLETRALQIVKQSTQLQVHEQYVSAPQSIEFPTTDGKTAYAFFYPPKNDDFQAPADEQPPLIVKSHGGPTAAASTALSLSTQYWTSRGFAVLDVNYGGSTGYGREYRERLNGQWGIVDVDDCVNAALFLVESGAVDPSRLLITGGSAGGYTTLCALTFHDVFNAGASHYGVSDTEALARDTHKFESRYLDRLFGPYPKARQIYFDRSPINFADQLSCPVIFFQGLEDKMVPPNQAEKMVEVLKRKRIPVAYLPFAGEQHGFRQAKNIKRSLEAELYFYSRVFGFELAEPIEPVEIFNL